MKIQVTQDDIDLGFPNCSATCPIALAIYRALPDTLVAVNPDDVLIGSDTYDLPADARSFVWRFDRDGLVKPFSFDLPVCQS